MSRLTNASADIRKSKSWGRARPALWVKKSLHLWVWSFYLFFSLPCSLFCLLWMLRRWNFSGRRLKTRVWGQQTGKSQCRNCVHTIVQTWPTWIHISRRDLLHFPQHLEMWRGRSCNEELWVIVNSPPHHNGFCILWTWSSWVMHLPYLSFMVAFTSDLSMATRLSF